MTKKYRLIKYECSECGLQVKFLIKKDGSLIVSILDKLHSTKQVLSVLGYYICIECETHSRLRFEYIYN